MNNIFLNEVETTGDSLFHRHCTAPQMWVVSGKTPKGPHGAAMFVAPPRLRHTVEF